MRFSCTKGRPGSRCLSPVIVDAQHVGRIHQRHTQPHKRRRRQLFIYSAPSLHVLLLWATLLSSWGSYDHIPLLSNLIFAGSAPSWLAQAHEQQPDEATSSEQGEEDSHRSSSSSYEGLDDDSEQVLNDFLQSLRHLTYLDLIVQASEEKKLKDTGSNQHLRAGPPVMIGRRRSLLERTLNQHYSIHYLQELKKQQHQRTHNDNDNQYTVSDDDEQEKQQQQQILKETALHQALQAYLFQTTYDAHIKTNPQRQKHNAATSNMVAMPPFPPSARKANAQLLRDMFYRSYNAYMEYSFPAAELLPLTCQAGTFDLVRLPALTLIDALDTLLVLGDSLEFAKSVERLRAFHIAKGGIFAVNQNVSVFETTIRVLGGLLSAHQMAVAYLKNNNDNDERPKQDSSHRRALPPVFLKDVFDSHPDDEYLQPPEHVQRILEQHQHKNQRQQQPLSEGGDGTCTVGVPGGSPDDTVPIHSRDSTDGHNIRDINSHQNNEDWRHHCGADMLALEDCASPSSPNKLNSNKAVNQTIARLKKEQQMRLLREPQWEYDGFLLELALDMGERLLPAFDTRTGIPYGTVNLLYGVPPGETTVASLAGGGTLSLEMELLSRLTGDLRFGRAAKLAVRALWVRRSNLNLLGKHIDIQRGTWTESLSGIGSNSDSFLEYLLKHYLLFPEEEDFWTMLQAAYTGIFKDARLGEWYADVDMKTGKQAWPKGMIKRVLESLMAFYPGMQTLMGELVPAARSLNSFFMVREFLGFLPERFSYGNWKVDGGISSGAAKYPLRPELLESCYFMHRATKQDSGASEASSSWQWAADFALHHLERLTRAKCGYASVRGLSPATGNLQNYQQPDQVKLSNEMPSFFLSETIKYLYLTFDDDNILHTDSDREWIFTTEAHPIHSVPTFEQQEESQKDENNESFDLLSVKDRLKKKLKVLKYHRTYRTFSSSKLNTQMTDNGVSAHYLADELWSDNTQPRKHRSSIKEVVDEIYESVEQNSFDSHWHPVKSFFGDEVSMLDPMHLENKEHLFQEDNNLAHMSWSSVGMGSGYGMRKACPNVYAPELTWVHALSGGALDYTDIYVSAMSEVDGDYPASESSRLLVPSAEALSVHGSGVYLGNMESSVEAGEQCQIAHKSKNASTNESTSDHSQERRANSADANERSLPESAVQQVELAGLGSFEISAFPEGSGFLMKHVSSGESVMATFIADGGPQDTAAEVTLMVYASMPRERIFVETENDPQVPDDSRDDIHFVEEEKHGDSPSAWKRVGPRLASLFKKKKTAADETHRRVEPGEPQRSVVIADLNSNAFHCEVNVIRRPISVRQDSDDSSTESEEEDVYSSSNDDELLASFPCAPALFGPTVMSKLVASNGAFVERPLLPPNFDDEFGCGTDEDIPTVTPVDDKKPRGVDKNDVDSAEHASEEDPIGEESAEEESSSCENKCIQIVQRGFCSFYSKSANQKKHANADGVIVINNEDEELFIMSTGGDESAVVGDEEMPVSVLVTGLDGDALLELIQSESLAANDGREVESYLLAQISVYKQETVIDASGTFIEEADEIDWPVVRGSEEALQILAEGGFGIHAVRKDGGSVRDITGSNDLQIFLLKHSD